MIEEFYLLSRFIRTSYSDFLTMPIYVRKYLVNRIIDDNTPDQ